MAAGDLTTLAEFKSFAKLAAATTDDALLTAAITRLSAAIKNYTNRDILQASYTDILNGTGGSQIMTRQNPITAVSAVSIDGITVNAAPAPATVGYRFDKRVVYLVGGQGFTRGAQNVSISYTAGYAAIPGDIQQAIHEWLNVIYREIERPGQSSKSIAGEVVAFDIKDMPARVKRYLNPWIRTVVPQ